MHTTSITRLFYYYACINLLTPKLKDLKVCVEWVYIVVPAMCPTAIINIHVYLPTIAGHAYHISNLLFHYTYVCINLLTPKLENLTVCSDTVLQCRVGVRVYSITMCPTVKYSFVLSLPTYNNCSVCIPHQ